MSFVHSSALFSRFFFFLKVSVFFVALLHCRKLKKQHQKVLIQLSKHWFPALVGLAKQRQDNEEQVHHINVQLQGTVHVLLWAQLMFASTNNHLGVVDQELKNSMSDFKPDSTPGYISLLQVLTRCQTSKV